MRARGTTETMMTATERPAPAAARGIGEEERRVMVVSSVGAVFEWYDFYLFATLAPFFATVFFPPGNDTAALLSALAIYVAGFLVRPFGALIFGRIGDTSGRQHTLLAATLVTGLATFAVGLLPTFEMVGWWAPVLLGFLRVLQGLALGGEYGGTTVYVAEHATPRHRGFLTACLQTTATAGFLLTLVVVGVCRYSGIMTAESFAAWGWRIPFLASILLLIFSAYSRLKLSESPVFRRMKAAGGGTRRPLTDSLLRFPNGRRVLLALFGATAGQGVVWYAGQIYAFYFLTITLALDGRTAYPLMAAALALGLPAIVFAGWLSDRIGRVRIILAGCILAALSYMPLFHALAESVNPALSRYQATHAITVAARDCGAHLIVTPFTRFSDCDRVRDLLTTSGLSLRSVELPAGSPDAVVTRIGDVEVGGFGDGTALKAALAATGYPARADPDAVRWPSALGILAVMLLFVAMTYGPIAAFLAELFPTAVRYTSMSVPYHIGNGWFGGTLPLVATAMAVATGDLYFGLWYPVLVAAATAVVGGLFLRDRRNRALDDER